MTAITSKFIVTAAALVLLAAQANAQVLTKNTATLSGGKTGSLTLTKNPVLVEPPAAAGPTLIEGKGKTRYEPIHSGANPNVTIDCAGRIYEGNKMLSDYSWGRMTRSECVKKLTKHAQAIGIDGPND